MPEAIMEIEDIKKILPHRYPFLLVDRVVELKRGERIRAIKNVTGNEDFLQGHFPGRPVMPGVLIIEAMAQAGGIMAYDSAPDARDRIIFLLGMDKVKFRRPVVPGDQLMMELESVHRSSRAWKMKGKAFVGDQLVAEADLTATMTAKDSGD